MGLASGISRRHRRAAVTALGAALALFGGARADTPDRLRGIVVPVTAKKTLRIGVTIVHLNDDFWKGIAYGIADEAKRSGVTVEQIDVAGGYGNVTQQFSQIQTMKTLGIDVAVVGPAAYDGYNAVLGSLKQSGIMVIAAGIPVNSRNVDFGITQDDKAIGASLADAICRDKGDKPATVLALPGPAGAEWAHLRYVGFTEAAGRCAGMRVTSAPVGGATDIGYGLSQASDMLLKTPDAAYIYTPETALGMGAVQAARRQNRTVKVVTSTVVAEAIPMVKNGRILAMESEPGILIGRLIVQYAIRKADGVLMPNMTTSSGSPYPVLDVPNILITQQNVAGYPYALYDVPPEDWSIKALQ